MLNFTSADVDEAANEVAGDDTFTDVARWDSGFSYVNGDGTRAFGLTPLRGEVGYTLRSGQQPAAADEIVLGPATAEQLGLTIGDSVTVASDPTVDSAAARVVGIALFPEIDDGGLTDGVGYVGGAFAAHATVRDLFEASQVVVTVAPGHDLGDVITRLNRRYPDSASDEGVPAPPGGVRNLVGVRRLPEWIAAFIVALGLASLTHGLTATRRRRRHDLATMRSLGLSPRQTVSCIAWQALTIGVVGLVVGIPIGLIAGRAAWWAVADPIGVRSDAIRPGISLFVVSVAALASAALLAVPAGWRASRATPAQGLRAE
jgi:predicted lysophospholipase L1 biosynthesis ABC-type transport system permease subunit